MKFYCRTIHNKATQTKPHFSTKLFFLFIIIFRYYIIWSDENTEVHKRYLFLLPGAFKEQNTTAIFQCILWEIAQKLSILLRLYRKCSIKLFFLLFFSFRICTMLAWVGWCLLDGISPSMTVLSKSFFQVLSLQIVLHNSVLNLAWSSPYCRTINHQTSTFANPVLSFHPFYMAKTLESHLPQTQDPQQNAPLSA